MAGRFSGASRGAHRHNHLKQRPALWPAQGVTVSRLTPGPGLDLLVTPEELAKRKAEWRPPAPKVTHGYLARYAKLVKSANTGAIIDV